MSNFVRFWIKGGFDRIENMGNIIIILHINLKKKNTLWEMQWIFIDKKFDSQFSKWNTWFTMYHWPSGQLSK